MYLRTRIQSSGTKTSAVSSAARNGKAEKSLSGLSASTYQLCNTQLLKMNITVSNPASSPHLSESTSEDEASSAENEASLAELILEQLADAVVFADETGTIRRWNHAAVV